MKRILCSLLVATLSFGAAMEMHQLRYFLAMAES